MEMFPKENLEQLRAESCAKGDADAFAEVSEKEKMVKADPMSGKIPEKADCSGGEAGQSEGADTPKKRGRPRKAETVSEGAKRRDVPGVSREAEGDEECPGEAAESAEGGAEVPEGAGAPKKRGRPRIHPAKEEDVCGAVFRKLGRPPKNGWKPEALLEGEAVNGAWETVAKLLLQGEPGLSVREIAKEANISRDMVYRYLKDEGFNRYLDVLIGEEIKSCEAAIWHTLKEMCMGGDLQAIKYYFELRGKREKEPEEQGTVVQIIDDVPDLSPEELKKIYGPLAGEELKDDAR